MNSSLNYVTLKKYRIDAWENDFDADFRKPNWFKFNYT